MMREWIREREEIEESPEKLKKTKIRNRNPDYPELESTVFQWIKEKRESGICLQDYQIQNQAMIIKNEIGADEKFSASRGWLYGFLTRNNLSLRRVSTTGLDLPKDTRDVVSNFICECEDLVGFLKRIHGADFRKRFFNMDETAIRLDEPNNYTYEITGTRRVKATTSGHEMNKVSVAFCASANGEKLPALILVPRITELKDFVPPYNVLVVYNKAANFSSPVIRDQFFRRVYQPHLDRNDVSDSVLIWDSAPCHKSKEIDTYTNLNSVKIKSIPPRLTNLLQPPDVCWFKSLKQYWNDWYINGEHSETAAGNLRSPGYVNLINWISEIWRNFDEDMKLITTLVSIFKIRIYCVDLFKG
ncbi:unnamed protein product [Brachionus calyciflorus]|uniref:HTH CENPB-type domain-containing protein n=1 Tax=Brachionus calyciflorus TaxID=104777 RepID=A0A813SFW3_9BILA|nr:unnamed protein product [Brachionus calyciflorus]